MQCKRQIKFKRARDTYFHIKIKVHKLIVEAFCALCSWDKVAVVNLKWLGVCCDSISTLQGCS